MVRRLPPLNALRAFEAAARHLSFTLAAEELHVTPAAVSHQVKALEDRLGLPLFRRLHNGLALTEAGESYLPLLTEGFDKLAEAGERLLAAGDRRVLNVAVLPSVAVKWLAHRLSGFYQSHPGIDVRIDATDQKVDFVRQRVDLALCYGETYAGEEVEELFTDRMFPVCSPRLLAAPGSLESPADLRQHTLLHIEWRNEQNASPDWQTWLKAAGVTDLDITRGPRFTLSSMAIEAAIDGQGVAMGQHLFADDDIAAGRLVRPFALSLPLDRPYCIACPRSAAANPAVNAFRDWIVAEAERYRAMIGSQLR